MSTATKKKFGGILLNILMYIFLAICIFAVIMTVVSKRSVDGAAELFGYQIRIVTSDSMGECEFTDVSGYDIKSIPLRSMVFVKLMPDDPAKLDAWYGDIEVGDVLTFRYVYVKQVTITHRVTSVTPVDGGYVIELAGDNKTSDSNQLYQTIDTSIPNNVNYVLGEVVGQSYVLGVIVSFLMEPVGTVALIILPCLVILILEVIKVVKMLTSDKKQKAREEAQQKDDELEELRRKLAALEQATAAAKEQSAAAKEQSLENQEEKNE